ncbi:MAG TPA: hypothetical protein VNR11_05840 [Xanthobacteraceae bacterium]|nr:hypothetical protein [Xanthobacteraceae bacterium]
MALTFRCLLLLFGVAAISWGTFVLVVAPQPTIVATAASKILRGNSFAQDDLRGIGLAAAALDTVPVTRPSAFRDRVVVELRRAELALADGARTKIDTRFDTLHVALRDALTMTPADPFLWLALAWHTAVTGGLDGKMLGYLALSYQLGPNEGWIAVRRNPLALAIFPRLPPELAKRALGEFARLVESRFDETPRILLGPGWAQRDRLLPQLATASDGSRRWFARALHRLGADVAVPGVPARDARPWDP